jgi:biopolymer transport protein TolR
MQSRLRSKSKLIAEINMVPFTDLVLVLLVIFMVTTPFLFHGHFQVQLPKVAAPTPNLPEVITLTITEGDKVYLNDKETAPEDLIGELKALVAAKPNDLVMINADKNVSHGTVTGVMSQVYLAGVTKVGIAVDVPDAGNAAPSVPISVK